jgi:hypothetical protein
MLFFGEKWQKKNYLECKGHRMSSLVPPPSPLYSAERWPLPSGAGAELYPDFTVPSNNIRNRIGKTPGFFAMQAQRGGNSKWGGLRDSEDDGVVAG